MRSSRRRVVLVIALVALAGAVVAHHDMPMDMHAMPAAVVCLAVLAAAGAIVVAIAALVTPAWLRTDDRPTLPAGVREPRSVPARAGPPLFLRLAVLRR